MTGAKFLSKEKLLDWLAELGQTRRVFMPVEEGGKIVFRPCTNGDTPALVRDASASPKGVVFPSSAELFRYTKTKARGGKSSMELKPGTEFEPALIFGTRPCGARGFTIFDRVYTGGKFNDPYYRAARENTLIVTLACEGPENTCFCNWVGSGPDDPTGSDVLATPVEGGFVLESVSERGEALLESPLLQPAEARTAEADSVKSRARAELPPARDISAAPQSIRALFDNQKFWDEVSSKCLSCGACTYLCPTCYCFTITDEDHGDSGKRLRSWDNCMSYQFSLEASGHNPRPTKAHRLRNRVGHKFSYYPQLHEGLLACCGCGRCIRSCPVSMDIREIVLDAIDRVQAKNCEVVHE
ncbi:MAG: 4Fe-4S dicluster domain-containing protein [Desulfobacteraceae bacterium]|nr:4Fe-4S dicluster domain-containing protein [Desulfobacteraceae bacterium]